MSVINHTWKFIFVHIPKCGGTSVAHALDPLCTYKDQVLGGTPEGELIHRAFQRKFGMAKHSLGVELRRVLGHETWTTYTTFATIRDPRERTMSTFRYLKTHQNHYTFMQNISSLSEFLRHDVWQDQGPDRMFLPQRNWLFEEHGRRRQLVDHLIPIEALEERLPELLQDMGVPRALVSNLNIEQKNKSVDVERPELSDEDKELIDERYACDGPDELYVSELGKADK